MTPVLPSTIRKVNIDIIITNVQKEVYFKNPDLSLLKLTTVIKLINYRLICWIMLRSSL